MSIFEIFTGVTVYLLEFESFERPSVAAGCYGLSTNGDELKANPKISNKKLIISDTTF